MDKFQELYQQLNPEQKKAVETIEGPVMVVAGPGTGKTQILTLRIANILKKTDVPAEAILALAFSESAVISMRRRLAEIIGSPAYSVVIKTFHGFCNDVIKNYPEYFPAIIGSTSTTEVDQINIIKDIVRGLPLKELKPFGDNLFYIKPIITGINKLKREGVAPESFTKIVDKEFRNFKRLKDLYYKKGRYQGEMKGVYQARLKRLMKNRELAEVYQKYQEELTNGRLYDYNDMIMEVLTGLLKKKELLLILQEQHQYILVDEHQDTNNAQNKILELLASFHLHPNIFLVGDEKQAIFRFQGASLENFYYFRKIYPEAKLITLKRNYRSTQTILDSAESLIKSEEKLKKAVGYEERKIGLYEFSRPEVEAYFLAKDIKEKLEAGETPEEIAVLYRDNKDVFSVLSVLEKMGIPFSIESDQDVLADPDIKKLILLLRAVNDFGTQDRMLEAMHIDFFEIEPLDIYKIIAYANRNKTSVFNAMRSKELMRSMGLASTAKIYDLYRKLSAWATSSKNKGLPDFFEEIIRESGFLSYIMAQPDSLERMEKIAGLFNEVKMLIEKHKNYGLKDFLEYLEVLAEHNVLIRKKLLSRLANRVRLMTVHKAKGLEFEYVYIINVFDGHWGNRRQPDLLPLPAAVFSLSGREIEEGNTNEDERRLFYVALTRAKKAAAISYAKEGKELREQLPSRFIKEIKPELIEIKDVGPLEEELVLKKETLFAPAVIGKAGIKDKQFIRELFFRNGLSVTGLNNYLACPWKYFYTNLLRIPKAKTKQQMYGTAVHEALKDFFSALKKGSADKDLLLSKFFHYLNLEPLSETEFQEVRQKGEKALNGYYDYYQNKWRTKVITEFNIAGIMLTLEIRLTGKVDKMELVEPAGGVNVVDYKTGKPKSRGEIEGSTRNSKGDIKRQLTFYQLLLDKYEPRRYKMLSGEIDFIEPDERGRYKKESFVITKGETEELEELIKKTAAEILNLDFWSKKCNDKGCQFCRLREMMKG